jgi:hypothetical protein
MLLLFAISVAPKQLLHDLITGHKHTYSVFNTGNQLQAPAKNFNCNWHNESVESPFTYQPDFQLDHPAIAHSPHINFYILNYYSAERFFSSLRGPPSLA